MTLWKVMIITTAVSLSNLPCYHRRSEFSLKSVNTCGMSFTGGEDMGVTIWSFALLPHFLCRFAFRSVDGRSIPVRYNGGGGPEETPHAVSVPVDCFRIPPNFAFAASKLFGMPRSATLFLEMLTLLGAAYIDL